MTAPQPGPLAIEPRPNAGRSWGQRLVIASGVLLAVVALIGALVVGVAWWKLGSFERVNLDLSPKASDKAVNFLVVGSDSRANISENDPDAGAFLGEEVDGQRTDTIIVMRVVPATNQILLLSIPRDLWVPLGGTGAEDRINAAFADGGPQELINTVKAVLGIDINHYVEVNFAGFKSLVDTIGGVPMYFDRAMLDENSGLLVPEPGCVVLKGSQALAFARSRHLQYRDPDTGEYYEDLTADLGRITRQQLFLRKAMDKATSLGLTDVSKLNRLVGVATDNVTFDDQMTNSELLKLARRFAAAGSDAMQSYSLPTDIYDTPQGASVLLLRKDEAQKTLDIFRGLTPTATTVAAPTLTPAQIAVTVLNGTGVTGQAGEARDNLTTAGFNVERTGDAAQLGQTKTSLRYAAASKPAAQVLAGFLQPGVAMIEDATVGNGVVLTTGADFTGVVVPEAAAASNAATATTVVGVAPPAQAPPGTDCR